MGDGAGKEDQQVGGTDLVFHRAGHLGEDFGPAAVFFALGFVLANHAVVAAYDYDAHF